MELVRRAVGQQTPHREIVRKRTFGVLEATVQERRQNTQTATDGKAIRRRAIKQASEKLRRQPTEDAQTEMLESDKAIGGMTIVETRAVSVIGSAIRMGALHPEGTRRRTSQKRVGSRTREQPRMEVQGRR